MRGASLSAPAVANNLRARRRIQEAHLTLPVTLHSDFLAGGGAMFCDFV